MYWSYMMSSLFWNNGTHMGHIYQYASFYLKIGRLSHKIVFIVISVILVRTWAVEEQTIPSSILWMTYGTMILMKCKSISMSVWWTFRARTFLQTWLANSVLIWQLILHTTEKSLWWKGRLSWRWRWTVMQNTDVSRNASLLQ